MMRVYIPYFLPQQSMCLTVLICCFESSSQSQREHPGFAAKSKEWNKTSIDPQYCALETFFEALNKGFIPQSRHTLRAAKSRRFSSLTQASTNLTE
jgi:hypothetical protein